MKESGMRKKLFLVGAAFLTLFALTALPGCPPTPLSPVDASDASDFDAGFDDAMSPCARACKVLTALSCPEALTLDGGKSCTALCSDSESSGFSLKPSCVALAKDVSGVRACGTVRCQK